MNAATESATESAVPVRARAFGDLLDEVASDLPTPGGGAVAGATAALAAALAGMAARYAVRRTPDNPRFAGLVEQADALRARADALTDADMRAYGRYARAIALPKEDGRARKAALRSARRAAAEAPLELVTTTADIVAIGLELVRTGNPRLRSDACAAAQLASSAAVVAATLVAENLVQDDPRVLEVGESVRRTTAAAARALAELESGDPGGSS